MAEPKDLEDLEDLEITSPEQYKALGHPLRHRLLFALGRDPATISGLARALGTRKGNIAHHLGVLRDAGLVEITETRPVRGGTEHCYRRTYRRLRYQGQTAVALQAVAQEVESDPGDPLMTVRNVRLTEDQANRLREALTRIVDDLEDAGAGEPRYGVLVGLYRPAPP